MNFPDFRNEYLQLLAPEDLATTLNQNPLGHEEALIDIEALAMSTIAGHLGSKFDLQGLRGRRYQQSKAQLKSWAAQIAAYLLYERAGLPASESVQSAYDECIVTLKMIGEGKIDWEAPLPKSSIESDWPTDEGFDLDPDDTFYLDLY